jgi:HAD superfamily hydrolase (TIGR01509 family)
MQHKKLKVKAILLDLDGTIVDSREALLEAARTAFALFNRKIDDIHIVTEIPKRLEQNMPIQDLLKGIDTEEFLDIYLKTYYRATATKAKPMLDIAKTLEKLSQKSALAVVTMRHVPKKDVIKELETLGLARFVKHVVTAKDNYRPKPSPEALTSAAMELNVSTGECAVVGDSVVDIRAGKAAGTMTVAVLSGIYSRDELMVEKPDLILQSVNQLPDFIE